MHIDLVLISKYCVFIFTTMHQYSLIVKMYTTFYSKNTEFSFITAL